MTMHSTRHIALLCSITWLVVGCCCLMSPLAQAQTETPSPTEAPSASDESDDAQEDTAASTDEENPPSDANAIPQDRTSTELADDEAEAGAPESPDDPTVPATPVDGPTSEQPGTDTDREETEEPEESPVYTAPASLARGRPMVAVWMNGVGPYAFLLDTALRRPIVSVEVAEYLGLSGRIRNLETEDHAGNSFVATAALLDSFTFAGMPENPETVAIMDLSALSARLGTRVAGILPAYQPGYEVGINFEDPSVTWRSLAEARLEAPDNQTALAAIDGAGAPRINVRVNGSETIPMVLDLNQPATVAIPEDTLHDMNILEEMTPRLMTVASAWQGDTQIRLNTIQAAGAQIRRPMCRVLASGRQARLGLGFLRHFYVTLNYEFGLVRLERTGSRVLEAAPLAGYGLALAQVVYGFWQLQVANNSPAFEAGIRTGDLLVGVNNQPVNTAYWPDSGYQFLSRLLRAEEGDTITLVTMRDGRQHQSYLMAQPLLN